MSGYILTWKHAPAASIPAPHPVDGSFLRPDLAGILEPAALAALPVPIGRTTVPLSTLFEIQGEPGQTLTIHSPPLLDRLGAGMLVGELIIYGHAGDDLGASMRGGRIHVHGKAGHRAGGPDHTSDRGMAGGEIVIDDDAGDFPGLRMRRGLIAVRGRVGASPGYRMFAGTIVVGHGPLDAPGLEMRRGTIVCLDRAAGQDTPGRHFVDVGLFDASVSPVLRLLIRRLAELGWPVDPAAMTGQYRLAQGDRFELSKGEVWQWVS